MPFLSGRWSVLLSDMLYTARHTDPLHRGSVLILVMRCCGSWAGLFLGLCDRRGSGGTWPRAQHQPSSGQRDRCDIPGPSAWGKAGGPTARARSQGPCLCFSDGSELAGEDGKGVSSLQLSKQVGVMQKTAPAWPSFCAAKIVCYAHSMRRCRKFAGRVLKWPRSLNPKCGPP